MVLTRAQQAAREAAGVFDEDMENTESVEPEDVAETSETAMVAHIEEAPSAVSTAPNVGDQLASLAHHLLQRTQSLAANPLMAMYALTETSVKNLTDQQRVIMVHDEQGGHIERFVNERLTQALQEVQRESKECKLVTSSQAEGIQRRLQEVTTKKQLCLGQEASELVQQHVQAVSEGVATAIKSSLEKDLQWACETMRQELLQTVNRAEEPLRESARALVLEIAAITERQLEARMQKAITNTQSELNLKFSVRKQGIRINKQSKQARQQGDAELEATIAEMVQKEVQERLKLFRVSSSFHLRKPSHKTPLIQSAVDVICKTIKDEVREVSSVNHGNATKDDKSDGDDEDHELERRMQEAWRKTYLGFVFSLSTRSFYRPRAHRNESSGEIIAVSPRSSAHREVDREMETEEKLPTPQEVTIVLQESALQWWPTKPKSTPSSRHTAHGTTNHN
ncbi:hypothetical protein GQ600_21142 [Phytophthora cactorum]|nr:hypothetical protein GQ600_21142 [Phytophthora cactorum]